MNEHSLFMAALDIADLRERAAWLERNCADAKLRERVELLLATHAESGEFLDVPALKQMAGGNDTQHLQAAPEMDLSFLQPSDVAGSIGRLGHYEIKEIIGRGGCGIVLKAFDTTLHRIAAVKVMAPELAATSPARKRFLREARASAAIRHDNVVQIYAVEEQPLPFLVMEYIAGQTLQQRIDGSGPLDTAELLQIATQIALGLQAAHSLGLIHRDIKPANVLLETGSNRVRISDFGLARSADDASLTQSGTIAGTPLYMSPEQAQGKVIDQRSDLFSLGSVLYVMASGRPPFRAGSSLAVLRRVAEDQPRPLQEIIPETPDWLVAIISKLHTKDPAGRFESAGELAKILERCYCDLKRLGRVNDVAEVLSATPQPADKVVEPVRPEREVRGRASRGKRGWRMAAAFCLAVFAGLGLGEASGVTDLRGTVVRLFSPEGTLVVELDDPGVSVRVDGEEMVITGSGVREIRLKPGQYTLIADKDGKFIRQELVTVTKNGRQLVKVSREEPLARNDSAAIPANPDARAAEYVLAVGGTVAIRYEGDEQDTWVKRVPTQPFELTQVVLHQNGKVSDAGLAAFAGCSRIERLSLGLTLVSNEGMKHFNKCKALRILDLAGTKVGDDGILNFAGCPQLRELYLHGTQVGDQGLSAFKGCNNLVLLQIAGTAVSDPGMANFKDCSRLEIIRLADTRVSDTGISHFSQCRHLKEFAFRGSRLSDGGVEHLRDCKELKTLILQNTGTTGTVLGQLGYWPKLEFINLTNQPVTDLHLSMLKAEFPLNRLVIGCIDTNLTDAGLDSLKSLKNLRTLSIQGHGGKVTQEGIRRLAAAIPACTIYWNDRAVTSE